jgi:outer membrane cobalamin receptor
MGFCHRRNRLFLSVSLFGLFAVGASATNPTYQFDIPAESLSQALTDFSQASSQQIIYSEPLTSGRSVKGLHGRYTAAQALDTLLAGTDLRAETNPAGVLMVQPKNAEAASNDGAANEPNLETVVVTGTNIRGLDNATAPVTVLDRKYIESTGITTTARLIETLPQNFSLANEGGVLVPGVSDIGNQGEALDLRGVGEGTTLVLINGQRMASSFLGSSADISAIPLSAVQRVEVLTDGASAIYGSDAVGGVVNFILRNDYDGAETDVRGGFSGGSDEVDVSQLVGKSWSTGNVTASIDYYNRGLLSSSERGFISPLVDIGSLYPHDENFSGFAAGRQELSDSISIFAQVLYTHRDSFNESGQLTFNEAYSTVNPQLNATFGIDWTLGGDWQIEATGGYADNNLHTIKISEQFPEEFRSVSDVTTARLKADGSLFELPGGAVRAAIGFEWRDETFHFKATDPFADVLDDRQTSRTVTSAFGEVYVPLIGDSNSFKGADHLDLSLAGRYDSYSDAGSSFNPRVGLLWIPTTGLQLRGSWGTSYVAPRLDDYSSSGNFASVGEVPDPGVPSGMSNALFVFGTVPNLSPQKARTASAGAEYKPPFASGIDIKVNYYNIDYDDQITNPPGDYLVILGNPASYGTLFVRNPSATLVNGAIASSTAGFFGPPNFDPSTVDVLIDQRRRNLSATHTSGIDMSISDDFILEGGQAHIGLDGTYIFNLTQRITATSVAFDVAGTLYNPANWKLRGSLGWNEGPISASSYLNYTSAYLDNRLTPAMPISAYFTLDVRFAYTFTSQEAPWDGLQLAVSAQNLFDQNPPAVAVITPSQDLSYDPTNANPMGRLIGLELKKQW